MASHRQRVVVVGASSKQERYSNRALRSLVTHGHEVVPVHPTESSIEGLPVTHRIEDITGPVDTVTLYVSAKISSALVESMTRLSPHRVIFNPGAENPALRARLEERGIHTEEACTLVLLNTNQF
jgi:predicted CoA-binding protein